MAADEPRPGPPPGRHASQAAFSPRRFMRSLGFAWEGLRYVARSQPNWRIHTTAAGLAVAAGVALRLSAVELAVLALTIGLVLAAEAVNTAVESTIDAIGTYSVAGKRAKDAAAGAVLVAAGTSLVIALLLFGPKLVGLV